MKKLIGVDIGGTKVAVGLIQPNGQISEYCCFASIPNDSEAMYQVVIDAINQVLAKAHLSQADIAIGVGTRAC